MAEELPKKQIKRVTVPTVSKEVSSIEPLAEKESSTGQNILLFALLLIVSGIVYTAIFQKEFLSKYFPSNSRSNEFSKLEGYTTASENGDSLNKDDLTTIIGQDRSSKNLKIKKGKDGSIIYPPGTKFYLIVGTYTFYPYAEKCVTRMKAAGYEASIISTGENRKFHRVYIESSTNASAMEVKRDKLNSADSALDSWVYAE